MAYLSVVDVAVGLLDRNESRVIPLGTLIKLFPSLPSSSTALNTSCKHVSYLVYLHATVNLLAKRGYRMNFFHVQHNDLLNLLMAMRTEDKKT